jgi:hypothetical protein
MNRSLVIGALLVAAVAALAAVLIANRAERAGTVPAQAIEPVRAADPLYVSKGAWGQKYDDQWALKRIGFGTEGGKSAWDQLPANLAPVTVAIVDTGIDYFHPDFSRDRLWRNPKETLNGKDDDGNGYIDDVIGWNFVSRDNNPFDSAGHGTHLAGLIAATTGNGRGIAGINPAARIMALKVLNFVGRGRSSGIAEAIFYAAENGARIINLSVGGEDLMSIERRAIDYAAKKGVIVVVASGNTSRETEDYGFAGLDNVIVVGATDLDDKRAKFSNWGKNVKIAAPGIDVLSLRARRTDFLLVSNAKNYKPMGAAVGEEAAYYRASGTSFSAPLVSGVASLILSANPKLSGEQVTRMILNSARDIENPGFDQFTGNGLLDARAALAADPNFFITARIANAAAAKKDGGVMLEVSGTVAADKLKRAWIEAGPGPSPKTWTKVSEDLTAGVSDKAIALIAPSHFKGRKEWTLRLVVEHENGAKRESRFNLNLG